MLIGAAWFGRSRRLFSIGAGGTLELCGGLGIEGGWNRLAETCLEDFLSENLLATGLLV